MNCGPHVAPLMKKQKKHFLVDQIKLRSLEGKSAEPTKKEKQNMKMVNNKNKKKRLIRPLNIKGFSGYDFHITLVMLILIAVLVTCAGCYSPDTVYVREYYHPRPFGTSYLHHDYHHNYHHDHHLHSSSSRRSGRPASSVVTPTRNPAPPPSRPISKGVPEPPSNPRDRR